MEKQELSSCICCNQPMSYFEMKKKKRDGTFEDMCSVCLDATFHPKHVEDRCCSNITELDVLNIHNFMTYSE